MVPPNLSPQHAPSSSEGSTDELAAIAALEDALRPIDIAGIHAGLRADILPRYAPGLRTALSRRYLEMATPVRQVLQGDERRKSIMEGRGADSWARANIDLFEQNRRLQACRVHIACSEPSIRDMATRCADVCRFLARDRTLDVAYRSASTVALRYGFRIPEPTDRGKTLAGCVARFSEARWWRRAIRSTFCRNAENIERELLLVHRRAGLYASDDAVARRKEQKARNRTLLAELTAVNDLGECFTLAELSDLCVSNPSLRRKELMTRIGGFEKIAKASGHAAQMITVTTPSRFHCVLSRSGERNPKFQGETVRSGQQYLARQWSRARAYLQRHGIAIYGFRIAEPHHDGTVHWHLLLFFPPEYNTRLANAFRRYFDPPSEVEPGSHAARLTFIEIDDSRGSAAGYVAKYVSKNIDGFGVGEDRESADAETPADQTSGRVDAWASTHGIRQFQQIGGPPVSVWREARRVTGDLGGLLGQVCTAADAGDWAQFVGLMGGPIAPRSQAPVRLKYGHQGRVGAYGEPIVRAVIGLESGTVIVPTRNRKWTILRMPGVAAPWTRVNNYTGGAPNARPHFEQFDKSPCAHYVVRTLAPDKATASSRIDHG